MRMVALVSIIYNCHKQPHPPLMSEPPPSSRISINTRGVETTLAVLSACIFAVVFTYPIVVHLSTTSLATNDWDVHLEYAWVAWHSVAHFGQVPHWDPYKCGGLPLLADPQARVIAPFFILHLIFGPIVGLQIGRAHV